MIGVLVENIGAFLDQFSISRITMGNIVSFIDLLELENTKTKLAQTLKTIQVRDFLNITAFSRWRIKPQITFYLARPSDADTTAML